MTTESDLLQAAVKYAKFGWLVLPCHWITDGKCSCGKDCSSPGKHPLTKNGLLNATADEDQIRQWWARWPRANVATKTGPDSKIWVLDIDLPDGPETLKTLNPLPETLSQKTGSGGLQYFFSWNGKEIHNSARKVAPGIDVRGINGYVLLPPSNHMAGNNYQWVNKRSIVGAPDWLTEMVVKKDPDPETMPPNRSAYDQSKYGQTALANEIIKLSSASKGNRNQTLNECAFSLSQLVAGGELDRQSVENSLLASALTIGLKESEARKTIESGFKAGSAKPRIAKTHETNGTNGTNATHGKPKKLTELTQTNAKLTELTPFSGRFPGNLTSSIREYIKENQGSFTISDLDREFGIGHSADKNLRRQALLTLVKEKLIKRDIRISSKYHILKSDVTFIDFDSTDSAPFQISMPLDLSSMVRIPKKSIIVVAGSTNAGKTALAIQFLKDNLFQSYPLMYLMSEMGPSEYKQRIQTSVEDITKWKERVNAASIAGNFDSIIAQHNPDGLTVIDFLEEIDGEYYKIPTDLRSIYDGLNEGVAIVCIQKHSKADVGRGGEGTAEKPRLYLTIDKMVYDKKSTISAVKIYKAKDYMGDNPNGLERHIAFGRYGSQVTPISDWMYCNPIQREKWRQHYEVKGCDLLNEDHVDVNELCFYFTTKSGASVRIIERDIAKWREAFRNINVDLELMRIIQASMKAPFLDDKKYYFQISGILSKKNNETQGGQGRNNGTQAADS